ncbi:hypothetical protein PHMEG_00013026 [Phytophthora megakarya]|uniref:Uncharacterized protein n=1 Tax=Phytophthora megakarya TaxID=4795 RepID=A0A225W9X7_9STRA|nr:hypothetical protein PHMEG_00013026 [Phytophthora megakarya]
MHSANDAYLCTDSTDALTDREYNGCRARVPVNKWMEVEQGFPPKIKSVVDRRFPPVNEETVKRGFPSQIESAVECVSLLCDDTAVGHEVHPRIVGVVGQGSGSSSIQSVASSSSSHSKQRKQTRYRRLKPHRYTTREASTPESVCVIEYVKGAPQRQRVIEIGNPSSDDPSLTRLPGFSLK